MSKLNSIPPITQQRVRELVAYSAADGLFTRRSTGRVINTRNQGYVVIQIGGAAYKAHRLAWLYVYGEWPAGDIDHINRVRDDNRIQNLRVVTRAMNHQNSTSTRSASGVRGVSPNGKRWRAAIALNGKDYHLGTYKTIGEAAKARKEAEEALHPLSPICSPCPIST